MTEAGCRFCTILSDPPEWYDEPLYERNGITVIPGLGAQRPGYLLIIPSVHVQSTAELGTGVLMALEDVKRDVKHVLSQSFGRCVFFEHGACDGYRAGACIEHAHVHALPLPADVQLLRVASEDDMKFEQVLDRDDLALWRGRPYVSLEDQAGRLFFASGENRKGQYMRRVVGKAIGEPDDWDYVAVPNYENVEVTVERLRPLFAGLEETDPRYEQGWARSGPERPLVYVARAVDLRKATEVRESGDSIRFRLQRAGFAAVDPVASRFPGRLFPVPDARRTAEFNRVEGDLSWLRRSDALVIDLHIKGWSYVGCICELVYAYQIGIPTIVITGDSDMESRLWLQYHATKTVPDVDAAIAELHRIFSRDDEPPNGKF